MARVYVSVGSNIERESNIRRAVSELDGRYGPLVLSSVYESAAVGFTGDNFYNLVIGFDTPENVREVARHLQEIENGMGRNRQSRRFSSRTIDLDLLLYDDLVDHADGVQVPRDDITDYAFVLAPLAEIAGRRRHPMTGECFDDLWQTFDKVRQPLQRIDFRFSAA